MSPYTDYRKTRSKCWPSQTKTRKQCLPSLERQINIKFLIMLQNNGLSQG